MSQTYKKREKKQKKSIVAIEWCDCPFFPHKRISISNHVFIADMTNLMVAVAAVRSRKTAEWRGGGVAAGGRCIRCFFKKP